MSVQPGQGAESKNGPYPASPPPPNYAEVGYPPQQQAGYSQYPPQPQPAYNVGYTGSTVVMAPAPQMNDIQDYCTWSIITTIFCCFWVGVFAIMKSQGVREAASRGDRAGAMRLSAEALKMNRIGLGLGIAFNIIYITILGVYFGLFYRSIGYRSRYTYYYG